MISSFYGKLCLILTTLIYLRNAEEIQVILLESNSSFPEEFKFGVATAAYQIEGGWNCDGRGPSIWDTFTHQHPELIDDHSNGDVGPDSYHLFDKDLEALIELQVKLLKSSSSTFHKRSV